MNKSTKGAIAAAAAVVLLTGGASTLAYWSDDAVIGGGSSIQSGELSLSDPTCGNWVHAAEDSTVTSIVPGDTITKDCSFTIAAEGDNLQGELTVPDTVAYTVTSGAAAPTLTLSPTATYTIAGTEAPSTITAENHGDVVTAAIKVSFPFGDETDVNANDTQNLTAELDAITVTLVQNDPTAAQ